MKISEIMDNYVDNEFLIEGESDINTDNVLKGVMGKVKAKKPLRLRTKIVIIAAAVAMLGVIMGASLDGGFLTTKMGNELYYGILNWDDEIPTNKTCSDPILPYVIEDGRVYFIVDGLHEDITDYINSGEIYCYYFTQADSKAVEHKGMLLVKEHMGTIVFGETYFHSDPNSYANYLFCGPQEYSEQWEEEYHQKENEYRMKLIEEYQEKNEKNELTAQENQTRAE